MEIVAKLKFARISPKKVQPLLGSLRRKPAQAVLNSLRYTQTKGGRMVYKLIASAVANAANNYNAKPENLRIKSLVVEEGPRHKRYWFRSHGSADIRLKRMSHINVVLEEIMPTSPDKASQPVGVIPAKKPAPEKSAKTAGGGTSATGPALKSDNIAKPKGKLGGKKLFTRTTNK